MSITKEFRLPIFILIYFCKLNIILVRGTFLFSSSKFYHFMQYGRNEEQAYNIKTALE